MATPGDNGVDMATPEDNEIRIVLLGKTGTGKSSLGNNLLGDNKFKSKAGASSTTTRCHKECRDLEDGKKMIIVDTPELYHNTQSSDEFCQCISMSAPGVHAFILVLQIGRFTEEELDVINNLQALLGAKVSKHTLVVFTGKASLDTEGQTIEGFLKEAPENLRSMLSQCGERYVAIDNLAKGEELQGYMNDVRKLILTTMDKNKGRFYTGEMFAVAEEPVQRGMEDTYNQVTPYKQPVVNKEHSEMTGPPVKQQKVGVESEDAALIRPMELQNEGVKEITIVLLGRIGAGKSSLGNNLLGEKKFKTKASATSVTTECQKDIVSRQDGKTLTIVDTPGMYDTGRNHGKSANECRRCIGMSAPKVHVFIIVLHIGGFHGEELKTIKELQTLFGERVSRHTCIVFTDKPSLGDETLDDFIQDTPENLKSMLKECGSRYVAVNNLATGENLKTDMESVIGLINKTVEFNGRETFNAAETVPKGKKGPDQLSNYSKEPGDPMGQHNTGLEVETFHEAFEYEAFEYEAVGYTDSNSTCCYRC